MNRATNLRRAALAASVVGSLLAATQRVRAHCDTLDGPVVAAARRALETGDVTPVLKWIRPEYESEVGAAFSRVLAVRKLGSDARALADRYFFETLVRVHRLGEGAPYTGLKSAGAGIDPAVVEADKALQSGSIEALVTLITRAGEAGIRRRFSLALATRKRTEESVRAGREFVKRYVEYIHYIEQLHRAVSGEAVPHAHQTAGAEAHRDQDHP